MPWHGSCYKKRVADRYPRAKLSENVLGIEDPDDGKMFNEARNCDNYICPFQCELCHFRNKQHRNPIGGSTLDQKLLVALRRANLDAFWARTSKTFATNRSNLKQLLNIGNRTYGIIHGLPPMWPHPLRDEWGAGMAVVTLEKSLQAGINSTHVQFDTIRKFRSAFTNAWGSSIHAMTQEVIAKDTTKIFVTNNPGFSLWFERFIRGMYSRMGDQAKPDYPVTGEQMRHLMNRVELDYQECGSEDRRRYIARAGFFFMSAFLGSLRGEEVPRLVRHYFIELNQESLQRSRVKHCVLPLYARFKGDKNLPRCYLFRVAAFTRTGLNMETWVSRVIQFEKKSKTIFLFSDVGGKKETGSNYQSYFLDKMKAIQEQGKGVIPRQVNVFDDYGISRSFRRGSTTVALNAPNEVCSEEEIIRNNHRR